MVKYILTLHDVKKDVPLKLNPPHQWSTVAKMTSCPGGPEIEGRVAILWSVPEEKWVEGARR